VHSAKQKYIIRSYNFTPAAEETAPDGMKIARIGYNIIHSYSPRLPWNEKNTLPARLLPF
jgi:hypothetical protein